MEDLSNFSMHDLFRLEAENQVAILTSGLLALERDQADAKRLEELMRAAHSLKGAARIVGLDAAVRVTHHMEDCFVAAQEDKFVLGRAHIDRLLQGVDLLTQFGQTPESELEVWKSAREPEITEFVNALAAALRGEETAAPVPDTAPPAPLEISPVVKQTRSATKLRRPASKNPPATNGTSHPSETLPAAPQKTVEPTVQDPAERVLRVTADSLNRLLGLAGESLVESRWLPPYADALLRVRRRQGDLASQLEDLRASLASVTLDEHQRTRLDEACREAAADLIGGAEDR